METGDSPKMQENGSAQKGGFGKPSAAGQKCSPGAISRNSVVARLLRPQLSMET